MESSTHGLAAGFLTVADLVDRQDWLQAVHRLPVAVIGKDLFCDAALGVGRSEYRA